MKWLHRQEKRAAAHRDLTRMFSRALSVGAAIVAAASLLVGGASAKAHKKQNVHCVLRNVFGELIGANQYGQGGTPTYELTIKCSGKRSRAGRFSRFTVFSNKHVQAPKAGRSTPGTPCTITGPFTFSCTLSTKGAAQRADAAETRFTSPDGCQTAAWGGTVEVQGVRDGAGGHKRVKLPFTSTQCQTTGLTGPA